MLWAVNAVEPDNIPNDMSGGALAVMAVVVIIALGFLLIPVMLAGRVRQHHTPQGNAPWAGPVQGGMHLGDGRSVAPHRDAEARPYPETPADRSQFGTQAETETQAPPASQSSGSASEER